ncbi:unnamed protein product [Rotaria sp. Silwood1]|nr:unnamed protein product [Rotaria sp. Silwood1]
MLNDALRTLEGDTIILMGFFIKDLHSEIKQLYQQRSNEYREEPFTIYRGQSLSIQNFEKLRNTKGGLLSFNNFLSTSKKEEIARNYAKIGTLNMNSVGILFKLTIDPSKSSVPFTSVNQLSYFNHEEVILSMHSVFRIHDFKQINYVDRLYQVDLEMTSDDDTQLRKVTERIREETKGETGWRRLGLLLIKISQLEKAEELFKFLLEQKNQENDQAAIYNSLGYIKSDQGKYKKALDFYDRPLDILQKKNSY